MEAGHPRDIVRKTIWKKMSASQKRSFDRFQKIATKLWHLPKSV